MLELCTGRSIGQTKPQYSVLAYSGDPGRSSREATGTLGTILHGCRVNLGILDRSASPMLQQHPRGCACTEQPLGSGGNSHSPNCSSSLFVPNPTLMNPTGKQFCSYLSQGEGEAARGSQAWCCSGVPWSHQSSVHGQSPTCIPHTGSAQGAHPTRGPNGAAAGLLHSVFMGFFLFSLSCLMSLFDILRSLSLSEQ